MSSAGGRRWRSTSLLASLHHRLEKPEGEVLPDHRSCSRRRCSSGGGSDRCTSQDDCTVVGTCRVSTGCARQYAPRSPTIARVWRACGLPSREKRVASVFRRDKPITGPDNVGGRDCRGARPLSARASSMIHSFRPRIAYWGWVERAGGGQALHRRLRSEERLVRSSGGRASTVGSGSRGSPARRPRSPGAGEEGLSTGGHRSARRGGSSAPSRVARRRCRARPIARFFSGHSSPSVVIAESFGLDPE